MQAPDSTLAKLAKLSATLIDAKQKMQDKKLAKASNDDLAAAAAVAQAMADTSESDEPAAPQEPLPEVPELSSEDAKKILDDEWQNVLKRYGK